MKIIVLAKLIPDTEVTPRIADDGTGITYEDLKLILNPYDEFAVEEAVNLAKESSGSSKVITFGDEKSDQALRTALAMGIGEALRIEDPGGASDVFRTSSALSAALQQEEFDLILAGKKAFDDDASAVGGMVASILNLPFVSGIVKLETGEDGKLIVHRESPAGMEVLEVPTPCLLSCEKGLNEPRYPSLMGLMKAKKKKIEVKKLADVGLTVEGLNEIAKTEVVKLSYPPSRSGGKLLTGEVEEIVQQAASEIFASRIGA